MFDQIIGQMTIFVVAVVLCIQLIRWLKKQMLAKKMKVDSSPKFYVTGDKHRNFKSIKSFCRKQKTRKQDVIIILGDSGFNYYGDYRDEKLKKRIARLHVTLLCLHGNKENRPQNIGTYGLRSFCGGKVYYEPQYPNLLFAKDGEIYVFEGKKYLVVGGAHSVDKIRCLEEGLPYYEDEMPDELVRKTVEQNLNRIGNRIYGIMTHTCPQKYLPTEMFQSIRHRTKETRNPLKRKKQSQFQPDIDRTTEMWLDRLEETIPYSIWYCGHYHVDKPIDRLIMMYNEIRPLHNKALYGEADKRKTERIQHMNNNEKKLFKALCSFRSDHIDEVLLKDATPHVLGQLFFNRMQGVAYGVLKTNGLLGKVNREFRNSLKIAYERNLEQNRSFFRCVGIVNDALSKCSGKYAMLKGAFLCRYYPEGYRTSNDIDLLVLPEDVTEIGDALTEAGFQQGNLRNGEFVPATRREIIESKMMRGETVPYILRVDLPSLEYLEVDINFSLDYQNGDTKVLENILRRSTIRDVKGLKVPTLENADFFLHLCSHLYKEATTLPWIEMKRDMTLYKYSDLYLLLSEMSERDLRMLWNRARELNMEMICAFAIFQTASLFDMPKSHFMTMACSILKRDLNFLHRIVSPKDKKTLVYTEKDIEGRFYAANRLALLQEEE